MDVYDAVYSMKQRSEKADREAAWGEAIGLAVNSFIEDGQYKVLAEDMWARANLLGQITVPPNVGGKILSSYGIKSKPIKSGPNRDKSAYDLSIVLSANEIEESTK